MCGAVSNVGALHSGNGLGHTDIQRASASIIEFEMRRLDKTRWFRFNEEWESWLRVEKVCIYVYENDSHMCPVFLNK